MDEACMYANIHVPLHALPGYQPAKTETEFRTPHVTGLDESQNSGLPILVMIHGGGFAFGSGGLGLHGPDYLMPIDVIVITFNYRYVIATLHCHKVMYFGCNLLNLVKDIPGGCH